MIEVEVGPEKDSFQVLPEGMTEVVAVDLDQVQELILIEIGLDVINVGSTIILQKINFKNGKGNRTKQCMYNMDKEQTSLKTINPIDFSLKQNITRLVRQAFIHCCELHQI